MLGKIESNFMIFELEKIKSGFVVFELEKIKSGFMPIMTFFLSYEGSHAVRIGHVKFEFHLKQIYYKQVIFI